MEKFLLAVDVGTTNIKCCVYDEKGMLQGSRQERVDLIHSAAGLVEISPSTMWEQFQGVVNGALADTNISAAQLHCMGICTQRNTFLTWDRWNLSCCVQACPASVRFSETGHAFHNFITWKDNRAEELIKSWNNSITLKAVHSVTGLLHMITGKKSFQTASTLLFTKSMVTMRLLHVLKNNPQSRDALATSRLSYGCIETWLLWKLTKSKSLKTEISLASASGLFDSCKKEWSADLLRIVGLPRAILPQIHDFKQQIEANHIACDSSIFGAPIVLSAVTGDQFAAMFGCGCVEKGSLKISLGTGTFVDYNTGSELVSAAAGQYSLIAWDNTDDSSTYVLEGHAYDTATAVLWAQSIGLFDDVSQCSSVAESVNDSGGVYFVPAFSGLQVTVYDSTASSLFIGLQSTTTKAHMVRAVLESLAFTTYTVYRKLFSQLLSTPSAIRCCGGVSNNNFVCQTIADLIGMPFERVSDPGNVAAHGAAIMAALNTGLWTEESVRKSIDIDAVFAPSQDQQRKSSLQADYTSWLASIKRSLTWHKRND